MCAESPKAKALRCFPMVVTLSGKQEFYKIAWACPVVQIAFGTEIFYIGRSCVLFLMGYSQMTVGHIFVLVVGRI